MLSKKPIFIIREALDGNGDVKFHIMQRWGWIWPFDYYFSQRTKDTLVEANKVANEWERDRVYKANRHKIKNVQDYKIGKVPTHIRTDQEEKYLKCLVKK